MEVSIKNIADNKLKKEYEITVPYKMVEAKIDENIAKIRVNLKLDGFRKGQVPEDVIKQKYGKSIMADESDKIVSETIKNLISENKFKPALPPKIDVKTFEENKDLEITAAIELYPEVPKIDLKKIKVAKRTPDVTAKDVDEAMEKLLGYYKNWEEKDDNYRAKKGDAVNIDYVGRIDGEEFEGGAAQGHQLEIGSKSFIDNFEDQLVGKRQDDESVVKVKFPKDYHNAEFAGKAAEFEVKVNKVLTVKAQEVNDDFVKKTFGIDSKGKLDDEVRNQVKGNYEDISRNLFKKDLFDYLNKKHTFELPEGLVEEQTNLLWADVEQELKANPDKFKNEKEQQKAKDKKSEMAQRMIRCGMILNELAQENKIEVTNEDVNQEISKILARYPGQDKQVLEYYQKNASAIQQLKGSIIEEKTIDYILNQDFIDSKKASLKDLDKAWKKANEE